MDQHPRRRVERMRARARAIKKERQEAESKSGQSGQSDPLQFKQPAHLTDVGNSMRYAEQHADRLRFVKGLGWFAWNGREWVEDAQGRAHDFARMTVRNMYKEGKAIRSVSGDDLMKWALASEQHQRIMAMVAQAQSQPALTATYAEFDQHPTLFNAANGVVDLESGKLREHEPALMLTRSSNTDYESGAEAPLWEAFLYKAMDGDEDLIEYLQRAIGYSMTALTSEDAVFFMYGPTGSNGKTTFLETIMTVLGSYATVTAPETVLRRPKGGMNTPELAKLRGLRLVGTYEMEKGATLDEARLKFITGGDQIQAVAKYKDPVEFRPSCKIWMRTNHLPAVDAHDQGIWRRLQVIPWRHRFADESLDKSMRERLPREESEGILAWCVRGAMKWFAEGELVVPSAVRRLTRSYRADQDDTVGMWLEKETVKDDVGQHPAVYGLYRRYERWCERNQHAATNAKKFTDTLVERGYWRDRMHQEKGIGFKGLVLVDDDGE